jgi:hypothetical protein
MTAWRGDKEGDVRDESIWQFLAFALIVVLAAAAITGAFNPLLGG